MQNSKRLEHHRKNQELEKTLGILERILSKAESEACPRLATGQYPIIFIMGCARCGSTLLHQFLANTKVFAYPTNLLSRFYYSTYIGSLIQQVLYDFDSKGELLGELKDTLDYSSSLGKTSGPFAPHEFWYFWRRFFHFHDIQQLNDSELATVDGDTFKSEIYNICQSFNAPLVMKGMIMNWHIPYLHDLIDNAYFIHIKRDTKFNAQSLLKARLDFFGTQEEWYSFKPPTYDQLKRLSPEEQVVLQVIHTNDAIANGLSEIPADKQISINYEDFCVDPDMFLENLHTLIGLPQPEKSGESFNISEKVVVDDHAWQAITRHTEMTLINDVTTRNIPGAGTK
jgi:hypothetical protein